MLVLYFSKGVFTHKHYARLWRPWEGGDRYLEIIVTMHFACFITLLGL